MKATVVSVVVVAGLMVAGSGMAEEMPALAHKHKCTACHAIDHKVLGPSWRDIAKRYTGITKYIYKGKEYPLTEGLVMKVSQGGSGNWGTMPMPANDPNGTEQKEITELIKFVQSLATKYVPFS
ncbi:MAG: c-type cytochrome [Gallionella sp.]